MATGTEQLKIAFVGGGSHFAYRMAVDLLLSETLRDRPATMVFMDPQAVAAAGTARFADLARERVGQTPHCFAWTVDPGEALDGADFVICAVERDRRKTWLQDYQIPLRHGFRQALGECGGPGGLFHYLRNLVLMLDLARQMEVHCPQAPLLCFTNPENRLPLAVNTITRVRCYGFCHGAFIGANRAAALLRRPVSALDYSVAGLNHFSWLTRLQDRESGQDLYPALRQADRHTPLEKGPIVDRIAFRRFGLWPAPGGNHMAEYIAWAEPFEHQHAWMFEDQIQPDEPVTTPGPENADDRAAAWVARAGGWEGLLKPSAELPIPLVEGLVGGGRRRLEAVITMNDGAIANLPADAAVEVSAVVEHGALRSEPQGDLPEAIAAMCRTQISIHKLGLEAFITRSKQALLQAVLIDPVIHNYEAAVAMVEEFLEVQRDYLPTFE